MVPIHNQTGDVVESESYRGMKLMELAMQVLDNGGKKITTSSTLGLLPGITVYTGTKCRAKLRY